MANAILAGDPLLRNDILIIARIIEHSLDYFHNHAPLLVSDYLHALKTVVGLGFTAALVDEGLLHVYLAQFDTFLRAQEDLDLLPNARKQLAQATAELVHLATLCFYRLKFPPFYRHFTAELRYSLTQVPESGLEDEVLRLLQHVSD